MEQLTPREWLREQLKRVPAFAASAGLMALIIIISMFIELSGARPTVQLAATEAGLAEEERATLSEIKPPEITDLPPLPADAQFVADAPEDDNPGLTDAPFTGVENPIEFTEDPMSEALGPGSDPVPMEMTKKMAVIGTEAGTGGFRGLLGNRTAAGRRSASRRYGKPPGTDEAVLAGLRWLKDHQVKTGPLTGSWAGGYSGQAPAAMTGLSLLAFLGYGCTDKQPAEFAETVKLAVKYILDQQAKSVKNEKLHGSFSEGAYSQAICTMAMAETYGMTGNMKAKESAQAALDYILRVQADTGGFDYNDARATGRLDMSISGFQLQAIKACMDIGIKLPEVSRIRTEAFLRSATMTQEKGKPSPEYHTVYVVVPLWKEKDGKLVEIAGAVPGGSANGEPSPYNTALISNCRLTAASLTGRLFLGHGRTSTDCVGQARWLLSSPYLADPRAHNDLYYTYYMSLSMFQMGGEYWQKWNKYFNAPLRAIQVKEGPDKGCWNPPQYAGGGPVYTTALACLSLEVYWRYAQKK